MIIQDTFQGPATLAKPDSGPLTIYACGVTPYDYCHLGHAKSYVAWDVLRRTLATQAYPVRYVQNFTDIDDKIIARSHLEGVDVGALASRYIDAYHKDMAALNIMPADLYPRVTDYIPQIIEFIGRLENRGHATVKPGGVYYSVDTWPSYGKRSNRKPEGDFCLWKTAKHMEPYWGSPWGAGRPGWHIECSAIIQATLGTPIDLHLGGLDLRFPHHENEEAQSAPLYGTLARHWLHNGMVKIGGTKMSKSLGNSRYLKDVIAEYGAMPVRLWLLQSHYQQDNVFSEPALAACKTAWGKLGQAFEAEGDVLEEQKVALYERLLNNLNTPQALGLLFTWLKEAKKGRKELLPGIRFGLKILGFEPGSSRIPVALT